MKRRILSIIEISVDILCIVFFFIKFIGYRADFPNGISVYKYFSPYQNLADDRIWLFIASTVFIAASIILGILYIVKDNKHIKNANYIVFGSSIIIYVIAMIAAVSVGRGF